MNKLLLGIGILVILSACNKNKQTAGIDDVVNNTAQKGMAKSTQQAGIASVKTDINTEIVQARAVIKSFAGTDRKSVV